MEDFKNYRVDIENKKQILKANKDIVEDTIIGLVIKNNYFIPNLTFIGKVIKHSDIPNCSLKYAEFNTYYLVSNKNIEKDDILSIDINKAPWYIN